MRQGRWGKEYRWIWDVAARFIADQFRTYGFDWLDRDWDLDDIRQRLRSDKINPLLATWTNGADMWLDGQIAGSPIRKTHLQMIEDQIANRRELGDALLAVGLRCDNGASPKEIDATGCPAASESQMANDRPNRPSDCRG